MTEDEMRGLGLTEADFAFLSNADAELSTNVIPFSFTRSILKDVRSAARLIMESGAPSVVWARLEENLRNRAKLQDYSEDGIRFTINSFILVLRKELRRYGSSIQVDLIDPPSLIVPTSDYLNTVVICGINATILRAIYDAVKTKGVLAPMELALAQGASAVDRKDLWDVIKSTLSGDEEPDDTREGETEDDAKKRRETARRQTVKRARDYLYSKGVIGQKDGWTWLLGKNVRGFEDAPGLGDAQTQRRRRRSNSQPVAEQPPTNPVDLPFDTEDFK